MTKLFYLLPILLISLFNTTILKAQSDSLYGVEYNISYTLPSTEDIVTGRNKILTKKELTGIVLGRDNFRISTGEVIPYSQAMTLNVRTGHSILLPTVIGAVAGGVAGLVWGLTDDESEDQIVGVIVKGMETPITTLVGFATGGVLGFLYGQFFTNPYDDYNFKGMKDSQIRAKMKAALKK